jgi:hypothetical protein
MPIQFPEDIEKLIEENIVKREQEDAANNKPEILVEDYPIIGYRERIMDGLKVAIAYADRLQDQDFAKAVRDKLCRSNVRGSRMDGVKTLADVTNMLGAVRNWKAVEANLKDKDVECIQGELSEEYIGRTYAAYASVREINSKFGQPGIGSIQVKQGYQKDDEYYFCTMLKFPTDVVTVQLKKESQGAEYEFLHQWFAGPELTSLLHLNDGDTIVRCGVTIQQITERRHAKANHRGNRGNLPR